jgi:hypothetical protein
LTLPPVGDDVPRRNKPQLPGVLKPDAVRRQGGQPPAAQAGITGVRSTSNEQSIKIYKINQVIYSQWAFDWPEAFSDQGAAVYVANTGYGYGDTDIVAYSEKVMSLFAERIGSKTGSALTIGQALAYAKQEYFGSLVQYEAYDEKALQETTFYGLPMFRIGPPIQAPPPVASSLSSLPSVSALSLPPFETDPRSGLNGFSIDASPAFELVDLGAKGAYYTSDGGSEANAGRPIEPQFSVDLPASTDGSTPHGIIVTGLQSTDTHGFNAVFSSPVTDGAVPEQATNTIFPSSIHNLTTFTTPFGEQSRAVFMPGQFLPETGQPVGTGTQRLFTSIEATVLYSNSSDVTPPSIIQTHAAIIGADASFVVEAEDDLPDNVVSVFALFRAQSSPAWSTLDSRMRQNRRLGSRAARSSTWSTS